MQREGKKKRVVYQYGVLLLEKHGKLEARR